MGDEPATRLTSPMPTAVLAAERLDSLAKPPGSLGTLEEWAATLCTMQATLTPAAAPQTVVVFCADSMWDTRPRCGRPARPQPADWPRLDEAWGSLRHALALSEASGAPAGRGLSHLAFRPRRTRAAWLAANFVATALLPVLPFFLGDRLLRFVDRASSVALVEREAWVAARVRHSTPNPNQH